MKRINRLTVLIVAVLLGVPAAASAQATARGIGLGAQAMLTGPVGASITYDAGVFHIDGIVGIYDEVDFADTEVHLGARFYYTVHDRGVSDLSIGGGLGLINANDLDLHLEGSAKIRIWLVSNVALSTAIGLGFRIEGDENDDDDLVLGSQHRSLVSVNTLFGVSYFFE